MICFLMFGGGQIQVENRKQTTARHWQRHKIKFRATSTHNSRPETGLCVIVNCLLRIKNFCNPHLRAKCVTNGRRVEISSPVRGTRRQKTKGKKENIELPGQKDVVQRRKNNQSERPAARDCYRGLITEILYDGFGSRTDVQFIVNVLQVRTNSFKADGQGIGNFLISIAFGQEPQDFLFATGK